MTRIESRPSQRRKWDYVFFIDIEGHVEDAPWRSALAALKQRASLLRMLGSYPRATVLSGDERSVLPGRARRRRQRRGQVPGTSRFRIAR